MKEMIVLAGGCFWGMEDILRKIPGVLNTDVGYCGGKTKDPKYVEVKMGTTGHAEAIKVEFDPSILSLESLFHYFFRMHDPTTVNRQGNDIGSQYRSAIFYLNETQRDVGKLVIDEVNKSGKWDRPIVTELFPFEVFTSAEDYHQDYLVKNPNGYTCHWLRN